MAAASAFRLSQLMLSFLQGVYLPNAIITQLRIQTERRHGLGRVLEYFQVTLLSIEGVPAKVCDSGSSLRS